MMVCVCHRVSDRDIARAARDGCASFDELRFELSVAASGGRCHVCARETLHHPAAQAASSRPHPDCGAHSTHGKVFAIAPHHHHGPMASAIG